MGTGAKPNETDELYTPGSNEWLAAKLYGIGAPQSNVAARNADAASFLADITPGLGETRSLEDAWRASGEGGRALMEGRLGDVAKSYLDMGAGLVGAIPVVGSLGRISKRAGKALDAARVPDPLPANPGNQANVFLPVGENDLRGQLATALHDKPRKAGKRSTVAQSIYDKTDGYFFSPEGILKREIPDVDARLTRKPAAFIVGEELPLDEVLENPALFEAQPDLRNITVRFTNQRNRDGRAISRTNEKGEFELTAGGNRDSMVRNLSKLVQYRIQDAHGFSPASRDALSERTKDIDRTINHAINALKSGGVDETAGKAYIEELKRIKRETDKIMTARNSNQSYVLRDMGFTADNLPSQQDRNRIARDYLYDRLAGNIEVSKVKSRATDKYSTQVHPYSDLSGTRFKDIVPLLPRKTTYEEVNDFLNRWAKYGSGNVK